MAIFDIFKKQGTLTGDVVLRGLPPHKMYSVSVSLFQVVSASSQPPFNGDPPADTYTDTESVKEADEPDDKPLHFRIQRTVGFYYLAVGVIAYLERDGKLFAQVERFFPMTRPCQIQPEEEQPIELSVAWPEIAFEDLASYGTVHPSRA
jgi:hypothetical protein